MEDIRFADLDSISEEDKKRLARMLCLSRAESGLSQEAVALELGIAKKTVQNWEKGASTPTLPQAIAWFRVVRVAAMPYFLQFMFPDMEGIESRVSDKKVRENLVAIMEMLPVDGMRQLMYLFYGNHGSSPRAVMNLVTAYLQMPLRDRYQVDCIVQEQYKIARDRNELVREDYVQPNTEMMEKSIAREREAVVKGSDNYMIL